MCVLGGRIPDWDRPEAPVATVNTHPDPESRKRFRRAVIAIVLTWALAAWLGYLF